MAVTTLTLVTSEANTARSLDPFYVGLGVRKQFLAGVAVCCNAAGVDWDWDARGCWFSAKVSITLYGPVAGVDAVEKAIGDWICAFGLWTAS